MSISWGPVRGGVGSRPARDLFSGLLIFPACDELLLGGASGSGRAGEGVRGQNELVDLRDRDRLTDREKYSIQGSYYLRQSEKTLDEAIEAYEK